MSAVYLETSAVLRWLLGEPEAPAIARQVEQTTDPVSSTLTILEAQRALIRAEREGPSRRRKSGLLQRRLAQAAANWSALEVTADIRIRAGEAFPVEPVRTLDAIHLATALQFARALPGLSVLTFERRILANLEPLGLLPATVDG